MPPTAFTKARRLSVSFELACLFMLTTCSSDEGGKCGVQKSGSPENNTELRQIVSRCPEKSTCLPGKLLATSPGRPQMQGNQNSWVCARTHLSRRESSLLQSQICARTHLLPKPHHKFDQDDKRKIQRFEPRGKDERKLVSQCGACKHAPYSAARSAGRLPANARRVPITRSGNQRRRHPGPSHSSPANEKTQYKCTAFFWRQIRIAMIRLFAEFRATTV